MINFSPLYSTEYGDAYVANSIDFLKTMQDDSVNLFITSPPFALQRQKEYGNKSEEDYVNWLSEFAELIFKKLRSDGSFVLDLGGAYQKGKPTRSLYNYRVLIKLCDEVGFHLAEEFFWHNTSKLPGPIEWVNKRKIRVKDSVNTVWWFSKTEWPKSDVRKVLVPYSERMRKLISDPDSFYTPKKRPSGHDISSSFGIDNGGSIPSNLLQISGSEATSNYLNLCKALGIKAHPARFPAGLPEFFIKMLTDTGDLVVDIFGGSNTTGYVAENLERKWIAIEQRLDYLGASFLRFEKRLPNDIDDLKNKYLKLIDG